MPPILGIIMEEEPPPDLEPNDIDRFPIAYPKSVTRVLNDFFQKRFNGVILNQAAQSYNGLHSENYADVLYGVRNGGYTWSFGWEVRINGSRVRILFPAQESPLVDLMNGSSEPKKREPIRAYSDKYVSDHDVRDLAEELVSHSSNSAFVKANPGYLTA